MEIVRALGVDTFVEDKMLAFFLCDQRLTAMGTPEGEVLGKAVILRRKISMANLAFKLPGPAVIAVKKRLRGTTGRAGAVLWDVTFFTACNGFYLNIVSVFKVRDEETPVPFMLDDLDIWKLIHFKFLIFWGMGIIESPLLERDISADKVYQPAVLLVKILNYRK